jgi:hypothetical protein
VPSEASGRPIIRLQTTGPIPPPEPRDDIAELLRLVGDVRRLAFDRTLPAFIDTVAAGWSGQLVYVRVPDRRYRLTSVWLDAAEVTRR